jgi:hypothetical protein
MAHDPDSWPETPAPERPPDTLDAALATRLRNLARCWIKNDCPRCRHVGMTPVRLLLTQRPQRADMPLRRAVEALGACPACGGELWLALVSHPRWQTTRAAGGVSNWSLALTGPQASTRDWTARRASYGRPWM